MTSKYWGISLSPTEFALTRRPRYAHMNNSIYNFLYDSVVNAYLVQHCGLRPKDGEQYGMVGKPDNALDYRPCICGAPPTDIGHV